VTSRSWRAPEQPEGQLPWRPWQVICDIAAIPEQAGIGARLGERQIALFRFGETIYALDNHEPGSHANVLSRGILAMRAANRW
jgi:nitrite reductase (NADH) large subunit